MKKIIVFILSLTIFSTFGFSAAIDFSTISTADFETTVLNGLLFVVPIVLLFLGIRFVLGQMGTRK